MPKLITILDQAIANNEQLKLTTPLRQKTQQNLTEALRLYRDNLQLNNLNPEIYWNIEPEPDKCPTCGKKLKD